jgi:hypothetical protein
MPEQQSTKQQAWQRRAEAGILPAAIQSEAIRDLVWAVHDLEQGKSGGGGRDYNGATSRDILLTYERVAKRLMHLRIGDGEDLLLVTPEQAQCCRDCIAGKPATDEWGNADRELLARRKKGLDKAAPGG